MGGEEHVPNREGATRTTCGGSCPEDDGRGINEDVQSSPPASVLSPTSGQCGIVVELQRQLSEMKSSQERDRRRLASRLRKARERLNVALRGASLGLWSFNMRNAQVTCDVEARRLLGFTPDEPIGGLCDFVRNVHQEDLRTDSLVADLQREGSFRRQYRVTCANGESRWVSVFGALKHSRSRVIRGVVQDITEAKCQQLTLLNTDRCKNNFLATLSHELRNPLAPIRNSIYVLEHVAAGSDRAQRARAVLTRQVEQLTTLIDELLDVTRISRGKIELRRELVDLNGLVARIADDHMECFASKGVALERALAANEVLVNADRTRIAQAIGNLVHNASKFTRPSGRVMITVSTESNQALVRVADNGMGIDANVLPLLFEPFVQANHHGNRAHNGLGLGLALVKGFVELHGGTVAAHSDGPGRGARFEVRLPLAAPRVTQGAPDEADAQSKSTPRKKT